MASGAYLESASSYQNDMNQVAGATAGPGAVSVRDAWVDAGCGPLFVRRWSPAGAGQGAGAPIVLFHDSLGCVALWRDFPPLLCAHTGHEVLAYDRLGFGQSAPRSDLLAIDFVRMEGEQVVPRLLQHCGVERFVAMGHSVGGGMAAFAAAAAGDACGALITESAQCFVEELTLQGIRAAEAAFAAGGEMDRLRKYHGDKARWVLEAWTRTWLSPAFRDYSLEPVLPRVQCPALVIHGERDEYGSVRQPERIAQCVGGTAELALLAGCHHVPHRERAAEVLQRIAAFLAPLAH